MPPSATSSRLHRRLLKVEAWAAGIASRPLAGRSTHGRNASATRGPDHRSDRQPEPTDSNVSFLSWRC
ncbi:hypothetical protein AAFN86_27970 [Roseomonas sp. CAU 1739]